MVLESLGISEENTYLESDIKSSIITHIQITFRILIQFIFIGLVYFFIKTATNNYINHLILKTH